FPISNYYLQQINLNNLGTNDLIDYIPLTESGVFSTRIENTGSNLQGQINSIVGGTGVFYLNSNPNKFSTSGNLEITGTALQNQLASYYLKTNPNNFSSSGNVET